MTWRCTHHDVFHWRPLSSVLLWVNLYMGQYQVRKCLLRPLKFLLFLALIHRNRIVWHRQQSEHPTQAYWWVVLALIVYIVVCVMSIHDWNIISAAPTIFYSFHFCSIRAWTVTQACTLLPSLHLSQSFLLQSPPLPQWLLHKCH